MSSNNPITAAAVVSNTEPAHRPGPEPLIGQYVRLERLTQDHFPALYENIGSHAELWTWWPDESPSTASAFDDYMNEYGRVFHIILTLILSKTE